MRTNDRLFVHLGKQIIFLKLLLLFIFVILFDSV